MQEIFHPSSNIYHLYPSSNSYLSVRLLYHKNDSFSSEIFGVAECEIIHSVNCEISHVVRSEMKFAHIRISEYFTFAEQIFHSKAISLARRANFVEKSTHCPVDKCVLFSGGSGGIRTHEPVKAN